MKNSSYYSDELTTSPKLSARSFPIRIRSHAKIIRYSFNLPKSPKIKARSIIEKNRTKEGKLKCAHANKFARRSLGISRREFTPPSPSSVSFFAISEFFSLLPPFIQRIYIYNSTKSIIFCDIRGRGRATPNKSPPTKGKIIHNNTGKGNKKECKNE